MVAAVAASLAVSVPVAQAVTGGQRRAAARAFADRTAAFGRAQLRADRRARAAAQARRDAAESCDAVWRSAPRRMRTDLGNIWFATVSGGVWSVDRTLFRSWIVNVRASADIRRSPVLVHAARHLAREFVTADRIYRAIPDACAAVTAWRDGGWSRAARPPLLAILDRLDARTDPNLATEQAARELRQFGGRNGNTASDILGTGIDEPDERIDGDEDCDSLAAYVLADSFPGCS